MTYEVLVNEIQSLPAQYLEELESFVTLLKYKQACLNKNFSKEKNKKTIVLGLADGKYKIPDDINTYDEDIAEAFGELL